MSKWVKRLRVFAGPNGSGKSTLYDYLVRTKAFHSYYHVNPDIIVKDLAGSLNFKKWPIDFSFEGLKQFLDESPFQSKVKFNMAELLTCQGYSISLKDPAFKDISYLAAALADFLRIKMLQSNSSFSFESVFSHVSKIHELEEAKGMGYKIYLYFITTLNPQINLQRVKNRVKSGGHSVPDDKIFNRYDKTMNNLYPAFKCADRAYLFDNSNQNRGSAFDFFAEKNGKRVYLSDSVPPWFGEYVLTHLVEE